MLKKELIKLYTRENIKYNREIFRKLYGISQKLEYPDISLNTLEQILDFERYVIHNIK